MIPKFSLLSQIELEKIHKASLEILETVGVKVGDKGAIELLQSAGAWVDENNIAKFPPSMVQDAIEKCSPRFSLYHRNTNKEMLLGDEITKHSAVGWMSEILDWRTGEYRDAVLKDLEETVKLCGALDEISWFMSPLVCSDVKASEMELYQFKLAVEHSDKPLILSASNVETVEKIAHLAAILAGGEKELADKPTFAIAVGLMSPLLITDDLCSISMTCAKLGIPIFLYTSSMAGANSPVTLGGTLAGNHAETLAAITLIKQVNPDAKIIYNSYSKIFDMKSADVSPGNPEFGLLMAASVQLAKYIGLPSGSGMFFVDSPQLDVQAGLEKIGSTFLPLLSGADFSSGMGGIGKVTLHSAEALVIDAEAVSYCNRILRGIDLDDEYLAVDAYSEVKPMGNFLASMHTLKFFRNELWSTSIAYKKSYSTWSSDEKEDSMKSQVKATIEKILEEYISPGLPDEFIQEFEKIKGE